MRKKLFVMMAAAAAAVSLTACGGTDSQTVTSADTAVEESKEEDTEKTTKKETEKASGEVLFTLRYAENQPEDYPTTQGAYKFAELLNEKTDGQIKVEVYHGGQLGDEKSVMEQLQFGGIDFTRVSLSPLAEFSKNLNVLQLPYLYRDADHMWSVLESELGDELLAGVSESGMTGLSWYDAGARSFYNTKKEIKTLEDLKGLKIRVQESEMMMNMVKALGAEPTPMAYGEVYSSMQTGVIDGAENNWPSYESTSHYEVARYFVEDEHTRVPEMQLVSNMTLQKLEAKIPGVTETIYECAQESAKLERELWKEREEVSRKKVEDGGAVITQLSDEEKQKFQDAMNPLYEDYYAENPEAKAIVETIRAK